MRRAQPTVVKDFKKYEEFEDLAQATLAYNDLITELNYILKNISIINMNCEVITVSLTATSDTRINHTLKVIPKYFIILRQDGVGAIYDIPLEWNRDYVTLHNAGIVQNATIALFKE